MQQLRGANSWRWQTVLVDGKHTAEESCQTCDTHQGWEKCQGSAMSLLGTRQRKHRGDVSSPSQSSSPKVEEGVNPRECIFSRKASISHLGCKSHAETLPCCQIGLPITLGKRPSLSFVTSQPEWGCDKNNAGEGSRKVWIDPTYLCCGITRKGICRMIPVGNDQWCFSRLHIALTTGLVFWMQYCWIITVTVWLLTP